MSYGNGYTESGEASATTANITKPGLKVSNSNWTNQNITATATFTAKSGVYTGLTWQVDKGDGKWVTVTTSPYEWIITGNCTIKARQYDASNNGQDNSRVATVTVSNIDKTGPTMTTVSFTKSDGSGYTTGTWSTLDLTSNLAATDNSGGSGISYYQYSIDNGAATNTYSGEPWNTERDSNVKFRAVDVAGNPGNWTGDYNIKIDKTGPTITGVNGTFDQWTVNSSISLSAQDNLSGIAALEFYDTRLRLLGRL